MLYLLLAILCSASMAIVLRLNEKTSNNKYGILTGNYITCVILAFIVLPEKNIFPGQEGAFAIGTGLINGVLFLSTLLLMQLNIRKNGTMLAATFSKLGMLLPVIFSIAFLGEKPSLVQAGGILLVIIAILIINLEKGQGQPDFKLGLILLLVFAGMADGMSKLFEYFGSRQYDGLFLFYTFLFALVLSLIPLWRSGQRLKAADLVGGLFVGIPNYLSTWFLLQALVKLPAYLVYPSYSVGTILLVSFVSILILKDKVTRKQIYGCCLILGALVLLNL